MDLIRRAPVRVALAIAGDELRARVTALVHVQFDGMVTEATAADAARRGF